MAIEVFKCPQCGGENRVDMSHVAARDVDCIHCRRTEWDLIDPPEEAEVLAVEALGMRLNAMGEGEAKAALLKEYERRAIDLSRKHRGLRTPRQVGCRFHVKVGG